MENNLIGELATSLRGILLLALFFGGSIFVHELGHFLAARRRGLKIERFSIGFGPKIFGWTGKDGVDYRIAWIPLGGYVALPQMGDSSAIEGGTDEKTEKLPEISYADKMIVAVMGAVFNVIFAFGLATILWFTGVPVPEGSNTTVIGHVQEQVVTSSGQLSELGLGQSSPGPAFIAGLRTGDEVIAVDDNPVKSFTQISEAVLLGNGKNDQGVRTCQFTILREGKKLDIIVQPAVVKLNAQSGDKIRIAGILPRSSVIVDSVLPDSPAAKGGLRSGDRILSLNQKAIHSLTEFMELMRKGGATEHTLEVESTAGPEKGSKRWVKVTPKISPTTNPVGQILYGDYQNPHTIVVVPVTRDLLSTDAKAARDQMMVLGMHPEDSKLKEVLKTGTVLDKVDGNELTVIRSLQDLENATGGTKRDLTFYWKRANGETGNFVLKEAEVKRVKPLERALIGVQFSTATELTHLNPVETCTHIIQQTFTTLSRLFDRNSDIKVNQMASVISISKTYYNISDDLRRVIWFTVLINLNLAILNLMPIPVLDGGHMLIATIGRLSKKGLNTKVVTIVQFICMALLFSLMAYVILNDVRRCSGDNELQIKQQIVERHLQKPVQFSEK